MALWIMTDFLPLINADKIYFYLICNITRNRKSRGGIGGGGIFPSCGSGDGGGDGGGGSGGGKIVPLCYAQS